MRGSHQAVSHGLAAQGHGPFDPGTTPTTARVAATFAIAANMVGIDLGAYTTPT
jgi:hypothetical protein